MQLTRKGVVPHHISGQTGGPGQAERVALPRLSVRPQDGGLVGHLQHIGHVAGGAGVQNGDLGAAVLHNVQHPADQVARVRATASPGSR